MKTTISIILGLLLMSCSLFGQRYSVSTPLDNPEEYETDSLYLDYTFNEDSSKIDLFVINNTDEDLSIADFGIYDNNIFWKYRFPYKYGNLLCNPTSRFGCGTGMYYDFILEKHSYIHIERRFSLGKGDIITQQYYTFKIDDKHISTDSFPYYTTKLKLYSKTHECISYYKEQIKKEFDPNLFRQIIRGYSIMSDIYIARGILLTYKNQLKEEMYAELEKMIDRYESGHSLETKKE